MSIDLRSRILRIAAVMMIGLTLSLSATGQSAVAEDKIIVVAQPTDMTSLEPYSAVNDFPVWKHIFEPLITFDFDKKEYVGVLATKWEIVDNDWVFTIRDGVTFHDGSPLTAADVKFSLERAKAGKVGFIIGPISAIDVVDDHTVRVKTKIPFANLLARLKHIVIMSKGAFDRLGEEEFAKTPVGTGPFVFDEWKRGSGFAVKKAPSYWGTPVEIDRIVWRPIPEAAARVAALEAGSAQVVTAIPTQEVDRLNARGDVRVEQVRALRSMHIGLSQRFEPFRNKKVREAMNYAIDVDSIIKNIMSGKAERALGVSGPSAIGFNPDIPARTYDPAKARALLAEGGYPDGFAIDFYAPSGRYPNDREMSQAIVDQLSKVGIRTNLIFQEHSVYWDGVSGGKWPMVIFGGFNEEDPELFLALYFETGITKRLEYSDAWMDKALQDLRVTFDPAQQTSLLQDINKIVYQDMMPTVPLYHPVDLYGVSNDLDWKPNPNEEMYFHKARFH